MYPIAQRRPELSETTVPVHNHIAATAKKRILLAAVIGALGTWASAQQPNEPSGQSAKSSQQTRVQATPVSSPTDVPVSNATQRIGSGQVEADTAAGRLGRFRIFRQPVVDSGPEVADASKLRFRKPIIKTQPHQPVSPNLPRPPREVLAPARAVPVVPGPKKSSTMNSRPMPSILNQGNAPAVQPKTTNQEWVARHSLDKSAPLTDPSQVQVQPPAAAPMPQLPGKKRPAMLDARPSLPAIDDGWQVIDQAPAKPIEKVEEIIVLGGPQSESRPSVTSPSELQEPADLGDLLPPLSSANQDVPHADVQTRDQDDDAATKIMERFSPKPAATVESKSDEADSQRSGLRELMSNESLSLDAPNSDSSADLEEPESNPRFEPIYKDDPRYTRSKRMLPSKEIQNPHQDVTPRIATPRPKERVKVREPEPTRLDYTGWPQEDIRVIPQVARMKAGIERVLQRHYDRPEIADGRSNWGMMHAIMVYGGDTQVQVGRKTHSTIGWLAGNNICRGKRLLFNDRGVIRARSGVGLQGHQAQFLAILALSSVPDNYPLYADGRKFTVRDLVETEKAECLAGEELTFTLIALSHYLDTDAVWTAKDGRQWSIPTLIREELKQPIVGAACGGTHRLMAHAHALRNRRYEGKPIDGQWARADKFTNDFVEYAYSLQNRDGSMSTRWLEGRGNDSDVDRKIQTTGHIVEWLLTVTPDSELQNRRLVSAVQYLLWSVSSNPQSKDKQVGPKGHALRSLAMYYERVFKNGPAWKKQTRAANSRMTSFR